MKCGWCITRKHRKCRREQQSICDPTKTLVCDCDCYETKTSEEDTTE